MFYHRCVDVAHRFICHQVQKGGSYIDATCGRGQDTVFLLDMTQGNGKVLAFDIQEEAIRQTGESIAAHPFRKCAHLHLESHIEIDRYADPETVNCIMFNLGYLPGSNHRLKTQTSSTVMALQKSLPLLVPGGVISIIAYDGKDTGAEEKEALLQYLPSIGESYVVIQTAILNNPNHPPVNFFIVRR